MASGKDGGGKRKPAGSGGTFAIANGYHKKEQMQAATQTDQAAATQTDQAAATQAGVAAATQTDVVATAQTILKMITAKRSVRSLFYLMGKNPQISDFSLALKIAN